VVVLGAAIGIYAVVRSQAGSTPSAQNPTTAGAFTVAMVTHEQAGDTFWDKVRAGAQAAAKAHNIDLKYSNNSSPADEATLLQNAIDSKVDGIATTIAYPDQVGPLVRSAVQKGIPVVAFNQGIDSYAQLGASMYFGADDDLGGQTVGQAITRDRGGKGKVLCVIQAQGSVALEARCNGVKRAFATTENLQVNGADLPSVQTTIAAKLQQDPAVTDIVTLGAPIALAAVQATADVGSSAGVTTFDLNADVAKAIADGKIAFAVDQQPYLQGYLAVDGLWLRLTNAADMGGGKPVLTGPEIVDKNNVGPITKYIDANTR
jgi:simple sugar transport system substrate-binding protein